MVTQELREKRGKLAATMREMNDTIQSEDRSFTPEENEKWDKASNDYDELGERLEKSERSDKVTAEMAASVNDKPDGTRKVTPGREETKPELPEGTKAERAQQDFPDLMEKFLARVGGADSEDRQVTALGDRRSIEYRDAFGHRMTPEYRDAFSSFLRHGRESRALQADLDTQGGFAVVSENFVSMLIQAVDDLNHMRQNASTFSVGNAESLGAVSLDTDPSDPIWTAEIGTGDEDTSMAFGKRLLTPHPLAKRLKVSEPLLRKSVFPADRLVSDRLAVIFDKVEENVFQNGDGATKPLGVFTASAAGIPTGRDVSDGNTTTLVKADGLINALYALKPQYMANAKWMFNRTVVRDIRKLKDGTGQYLWIGGLAGAPDTILGHEFMMSEFTPNTMTAGLYVGMIADWSFYWVADAIDMQIKRLDELYAEANQVGFIARKEMDAMPVLAEAFSRIKLAP